MLTWLDPKEPERVHVVPVGRATCVAGRGGQGCGIVEFESAESAAEAINTLHLSEVCSMLLIAAEAIVVFSRQGLSGVCHPPLTPLRCLCIFNSYGGHIASASIDAGAGTSD